MGQCSSRNQCYVDCLALSMYHCDVGGEARATEIMTKNSVCDFCHHLLPTTHSKVHQGHQYILHIYTKTLAYHYVDYSQACSGLYINNAVRSTHLNQLLENQYKYVLLIIYVPNLKFLNFTTTSVII